MLFAPASDIMSSLNIVVIIIIAASIIVISSYVMPDAYSQDVGLATFHEGLTILVDRSGSQNVTTSVTLQSVSTQEMKIPESLESQIREDGRISAIVLTNQEQCILGVVDKSCILLSTERDPNASGILAIQESARNTADLYIDEINQVFDTGAIFHSVFVHSGNDGASDTALPTSAMGRTTVSVVYVMPMEDTDAMYDKISSILLPSVIRESGGFYNVAKKLSFQENAKMSFSFIPLDSRSLFQLKIISPGAINASSIDVIRPLDLVGLDTLERSDYFASGFYPLNSIMQIAISSSNPATMISDSLPALIPTRDVDGEKVPTDVNVAGWIFDPPNGKLIHAKYLFGTQMTLASDDLEISLHDKNNNNIINAIDDTSKNTTNDDNLTSIDDIDIVNADGSEQIMIVIAVVAAAVAAVIFYLRGYSGKSIK